MWAGKQKQVYELCGWPMKFLRYLATYGLACRIGYELCGWQASGIPVTFNYVRLASTIGYEVMQLASVTSEAFNNVGCESVMYEAMWEANEIPQVFGYKVRGRLDQVCCYVAGK